MWSSAHAQPVATSERGCTNVRPHGISVRATASRQSSRGTSQACRPSTQVPSPVRGHILCGQCGGFWISLGCRTERANIVREHLGRRGHPLSGSAARRRSAARSAKARQLTTSARPGRLTRGSIGARRSLVTRSPTASYPPSSSQSTMPRLRVRRRRWLPKSQNPKDAQNTQAATDRCPWRSRARYRSSARCGRNSPRRAPAVISRRCSRC